MNPSFLFLIIIIITIILMLEMSLGFPSYDFKASLTDSTLVTKTLQNIANGLQPQKVTTTDPDKTLNWLQPIRDEIESVPQFQALMECARKELELDKDEPWETIAGLTTSSQEVILRPVRASNPNPISIAQILSNFLNRTGVDRVMDAVRKMIERNVDVQRITSLLDGPAWNYILNLLTNLPIFTVFRQDLKLDSDRDLQQMIDRFKQMLSSERNQNPVCGHLKWVTGTSNHGNDSRAKC